ncbi:MAG: regulatory protein RecX [Chlamydiae bacterium]|nr:regulatory protein RecX [Chlamydiota bacterium]
MDSYKELELKAIVKHALTMLGKRSYFTVELSKRLSAEGFSHAAVDHALEIASRCGALDDERRARYLIEKALERGKSKMSILYVFKKLGVDLHMINTLLDQMANDPRKQICALYDKKYSKKGPLDISNKRKVVQFFQRKGFALDDIFFVLQKKM